MQCKKGNGALQNVCQIHQTSVSSVRLCQLAFGNVIDCHISKQIGCVLDEAIDQRSWQGIVWLIADGDSVQNTNVVFAAQSFKVFKGAKMNVWRVIPLVR